MELESPFARIARTRADFRAKRGAAGDDLVVEIDRHLEARIAADQLLQFACLEFEKAELAMRWSAIEAAKPKSNGIEELLSVLDKPRRGRRPS